MKLSRVSAVNWNKIQDDKDLGGMEPPDQQLLAAGKGAALQRYSGLGKL